MRVLNKVYMLDYYSLFLYCLERWKGIYIFCIFVGGFNYKNIEMLGFFYIASLFFV